MFEPLSKSRSFVANPAEKLECGVQVLLFSTKAVDVFDLFHDFVLIQEEGTRILQSSLLALCPLPLLASCFERIRARVIYPKVESKRSVPCRLKTL